MGLSLGQGAAVYVGLIMSILIGPTAFATPLLTLEDDVATSADAVTLPSPNATNLRRDVLAEERSRVDGLATRMTCVESLLGGKLTADDIFIV